MATILHKELSDTVIGIAMRVHTRLGSGLPELCYQRALEHELYLNGIPYTSQQRHEVSYDDEPIGFFITDIIIDNKIILELKADELITDGHLSQLITYLRVTNIKLGYLISFGARSLLFKRLVL